MKTRHCHRHASFVVWLASSVALVALLGTASSVRADTQYYEYDGSVFTGPFDFFPIDKYVSFYDMSGNALYVGAASSGSFSALAGAWLKVDALLVGNDAAGDGAVAVAGGRIDIGGSWATGARVRSPCPAAAWSTPRRTPAHAARTAGTSSAAWPARVGR